MFWFVSHQAHNPTNKDVQRIKISDEEIVVSLDYKSIEFIIKIS